MKHRAVVLALASASIALPSSAHAADDLCSRLIIQAVNQFCQLLPNGLNLCQPVALVGPNPQCNTSEPQALVPVPLGPATLQPLAPWTAPYASAWPATQAATNIPFSTRPAVAAPARPVAPTPPEHPHITAEIAKPVAVARPATPAAAAPVAPVIAPTTTPAAQLPPPVAAAPGVPSVAVAPATVASATAGPSKIPAPVVTAGSAPVAVAATPSAAPATQTAAVPAVEPLPAAPSVAVATAPISVPPAVPDAAQPPATQTLAVEEATVDALAHFDFDSATLTAVGRAVLDAWLTEAPKDKSIRVSGYADRLGPEPYNLKLSLRRADAVKQYLAGKGYDPRRIQLEAKGEAEPVKRCKGDATPITKACLAPNRRVKIDPE